MGGLALAAVVVATQVPVAHAQGWVATFGLHAAIAAPCVVTAFVVVLCSTGLFMFFYSGSGARGPRKMNAREVNRFLGGMLRATFSPHVKAELRHAIGSSVPTTVVRLASYGMFRGSNDSVSFITVAYASFMSAFILSLFTRGRSANVHAKHVFYNYCLFWIIESDLMRPFSSVGAAVGAHVLSPFLHSLWKTFAVPFDFKRFLFRGPVPSIDRVITGEVDPEQIMEQIEPDMNYPARYVRQFINRVQNFKGRGMRNFGAIPPLTDETLALGLGIQLHTLAVQKAQTQGVFD